MKKVLIFALAIGGCSDRLSPWERDSPNHLRNLTNRNLEKIQDLSFPAFPITIALIGDPQGSPLDLEKVVERINQRDSVSFTLVVGDLTNHGLLHEFVWTAEGLERLSKPYFTVIGNHDAIAHGKSIYKEMFGDFDYYFYYGQFKFVMWNNNQFEFGTSDFNWLKNQVNQDSFVVAHVPPVKDMHSLEQIEEWKKINQMAKIMGSIHGHRGGKKDYYVIEEEVPYYIVPKLDGKYYSLMTIEEDGQVKFEICNQSCQPSVQGSAF